MSSHTRVDPITRGTPLQMARLHGFDDENRLLIQVDADGAVETCVIGVPMDDGALVQAVSARQNVLIARLEGQPPIVVSLVRERVSPAALKGRRVIESTGTLEIRSGKASLTLRPSGKVVVRGTHVVSASSGPNKIKGASIALN